MVPSKDIKAKRSGERSWEEFGERGGSSRKLSNWLLCISVGENIGGAPLWGGEDDENLRTKETGKDENERGEDWTIDPFEFFVEVDNFKFFNGLFAIDKERKKEKND